MQLGSRVEFGPIHCNRRQLSMVRIRCLEASARRATPIVVGNTASVGLRVTSWPEVIHIASWFIMPERVKTALACQRMEAEHSTLHWLILCAWFQSGPG